MLPTEFYMLNATTALLWLFQNCSHEVLLFVVILGVLCILVSICTIVVRLVRIVFSIALIIACIFLRRVFQRYFAQDATQRNTRMLTQSNSIANSEANSLSLGRIIGSIVDSSQPRSLSLPQALALHPAQWSQIETNPTPAALPPSESSVPLVSTETVVLRPPLRRSRRVPRARIAYSE